MMIVECKYGYGDIVYLKTDSDQSKWIVCSILVTKAGVIYNLSSGIKTYGAYDFEISLEKDILITSTN